MSIRVSDPLFLLSAQTGLSVGELKAKAAAANPDVNKPQEALKTGEPIPILFGRFRNGSGGVMAQPKITEGYFANPIVEEEYDYGSSTAINAFQAFQIKYLFVLSEGELAQMQIRDVFFGSCRVGTFNQKYNGRAGAWNPGNDIDDHFTDIILTPTNGVFNYNPFNLTQGQSARLGNTVWYKSSFALHQQPYVESSFPTFCGTSGTYSGLTTFSFEHQVTAGATAKLEKSLSIFVRNGLKVTRLVDGVTAESDNYVDLVKYLFQTGNRLADDLIDNTALTTAANFADTNSFLFNGAVTESQNLLDWIQQTSVNFLLRITNSGGKFGLQPRLPYNTDYTIKTTQVTPEFTFTEEHVVDGGFEIEYISLEDRQPACFVIQWRQQPEAEFGLVRTVEVRYAGEATSGPFVNIDMSGYCTNENHAVKVGAFRLAQRKFVTHHLRLTVREQNYSSTLVVGDLVRVRLRRETDAGEVAYHDKLYEINRVEKTFSSTIVYDLTHFPIDTQGRSIIAREVADAVGAGNTIDVGRSTFDCDENSSTDTTPVPSNSGGGGTQPPSGDTGVDLTPVDGDSSYPDGPNSPDDPLDQPSVSGNPQIGGYSGSTPVAGDTLSFAPGCPDAYIEWFAEDQTTGELTPLGSGVSATLAVTQAMENEGLTIIGIGRCPDPSAPDGYGEPIQSNSVNLLPVCEPKIDGCREMETNGYGQLQFWNGTNWLAAGQTGSQTLTAQAVRIVSTDISEPFAGGQIYALVTFTTVNYGTIYNMPQGSGTAANAAIIKWRINPTFGSCAVDCTIT
jgi:hypothetical protein